MRACISSEIQAVSLGKNRSIQHACMRRADSSKHPPSDHGNELVQMWTRLRIPKKPITYADKHALLCTRTYVEHRRCSTQWQYLTEMPQVMAVAGRSFLSNENNRQPRSDTTLSCTPQHLSMASHWQCAELSRTYIPAVQQVLETATAWTPSAAQTIISNVTCVTAGTGCDVAANNVFTSMSSELLRQVRGPAGLISH